MRLRIKNNLKGPRGIEKAGGGFVFIAPGETRVVEVANPDALFGVEFLDVEIDGYQAGPIPADLAARFDHDGDGKPGGSLPHDPPSLAGKNKAQLKSIARGEQVTIPRAATNRQIREAIEAKRASK